MYNPYNPNHSPIPSVPFNQPGLGYGYYAAIPTAPVSYNKWATLQAVKAPLKKGDRGADVTYAWRLFWNMGSYKGEKPVESVDSKYAKESNLFSAEYNYTHPTHWAEARSGVFGNLLEERVKWLQGEQGLPVTGIIDTATWKELGKLNGITVEVSPTGTGKSMASSSLDSMDYKKKMMNNILLAVGAVSVLGIGWYMMTRR